jgi:hypothetical protein
MTSREKILTFGVGGILVMAGCQYLWMQYRSAVNYRQERVAALDQQIFEAREKLLQGAYADRMMGEYLARSLPSDTETARSDYARWLYEIGTMVHLRDASFKADSAPRRVADAVNQADTLYMEHNFSVVGKTDFRGWLDLLYVFFAKDQLHRISDLTVTPSRDGDLTVDLKISAISLSAALPDLPASEEVSPLVDSYVSYEEPILNRNFFSPPNQPPRFTSPARMTVNVGEAARLTVAAEDPEKQRLRYDLVGEPPEGLELDSRSGTIAWKPEATGTHRLIVRVTDDGYPAQSIEQPFEVAVVDPPPPPKAEPPSPGFDDATQTVLTGLVKGGGDWTAWMNVRTKGTTLKLRPGDKFEIGKLSGTVVEVNSRFAVLEIDGKQFELRQAGNLAEAARAAIQ